MKKIIYIIIYSVVPFFLNAQTYTNWIVGDTSDFMTTDYLSGVVLAGGGTDNDEAMQWMLNRSGGGDVVVLRASNSDGYNDYFFSELGVAVNSVETIRFDAAAAAFDDYVITQIQNAEIIFMAGGDQYDYYQYWKDTPIEDALNSLINDKGITIGGTSAGMAILGDAYYATPGGSLDSEEALGNPFHPDTELIGKSDFLSVPILTNIITDTHYDQRERWGRHLTFLARVIHDFGTPALGIASNEFTAVCIDENGIARAFGEYPTYDDYTYFLSTVCNEEPAAEVLELGTPITWNKEGTALAVYKLPGTITGEHTFDLNNWEPGSGGTWEQWYAIEGELFQESVDSICDFSTGVNNIVEKIGIEILPNPVEDFLTIKRSKTTEKATISIVNTLGQIRFRVLTIDNELKVDLRHLSAGIYFAKIEYGTSSFSKRFMKK